MKYHAPTNTWVFGKPETAKWLGLVMTETIRHVRHAVDLPLTGYKDVENGSPQFHAKLAEQNVLSLAEELGIDLGANWPGKLDVTPRDGQ